MKCFAFACLLFIISGSFLLAGEKKETKLTPMLGDDFAVLIEVTGTIRDERDTRRRKDLGYDLIEVTHVNEKQLEKPVMIRLLVFSFSSIEIPPRGTAVMLRGYETGGFRGIPNEAFKDIPPVSTMNHHFEHLFQVTKILNPANAQKRAAKKGN